MLWRRTLLILFLYIALAWVVVALKYEGPEIQKEGLFWTAVGIAVILVFLAVDPLHRLWKSWRAKRAARPAPVAEVAKPIHPDDATFATLWKEAERALASSPEYGAQGKRLVLRELPLYLLIGPSKVGKTSTFTNAGIDAHLLAGQVRGDMGVQPTRLANIWIAQNAVFVELSGRLYDGDLARWTEFLKSIVNEPRRPAPWWQWWGPEEERPRGALHAVVVFQSLANYTAEGNGAAVSGQAVFVQERLQAIAETFSCAMPIYTIFTQADRVKFFDDFFRGMPEAESGQAFGYLLPREATPSGPKNAVWAEAENRRISKVFNEVSFRLAGRRVLHLAREEDPGRRRGVYEFPREFRRLRSAIAQFLTETFQPNPLRPNAVLRGFFFTGKRQVSVDQPPVGQTRPDWTSMGDAPVPHIFRPEATEIFKRETVSGPVPIRPSSGWADRWMFVSQFLGEILRRDSATAPRLIQVQLPVKRQRPAVVFGAAAAATLFCLIWLQSWWGNREILHSVHAAVEANRARSSSTEELVPLSQWQSLEQLRGEVERLAIDPQLRVHWGLYVGDTLEPDARKLYFERFRHLILEPINQRLIAKLTALPSVAGEDAPFDDPYQTLQTHVAITSRRCSVDPVAIGGVLKEEAAKAGLTLEGERQGLIHRQIDFYTEALRSGRPMDIGEDGAASEHAAAYLSQIKGPQRVYRAILEQASRSVTSKASLAELAPEYMRVLNGPAETDKVFTPAGAKFVEQEAKSGKHSTGTDTCLFGGDAASAGTMQKAILALYLNEYRANWKRYLKSFKAQPYRDAADAAGKLEIFSAHTSPLLALMLLTANNTYFPEPTEQTSFKENAAKVGGKIGLGGLLKTADKTSEKIAKLKPAEAQDSPAEITKAFQPVHWVVPAGSDLWVTERNTAYVNALSELRKSMVEISSGGSASAPGVHQQALASYEKARDAVRQLAIGFKPVGSEGIDSDVAALLEEPIQKARRFIEDDPEKPLIAKLNKDAAELCSKMRVVSQKYPFTASAKQDASLEDIARFFTPGTGLIWKYQQDSLAAFVAKEGKQWILKPDSKLKLSPDVLAFLKKAEEMTNAFYENGPSKIGFRYTLGRDPSMSLENRTVIFHFDGNRQVFSKDSLLRKEFSWPAPTGAAAGAEAFIDVLDQQFPFGSGRGPWGVFRVFGDAEARPLESKVVEWKYNRVAGGQASAINPPVRMQIVDFPAGADLFNPAFFEGFRCVVRPVP